MYTLIWPIQKPKILVRLIIDIPFFLCFSCEKSLFWSQRSGIWKLFAFYNSPLWKKKLLTSESLIWIGSTLAIWNCPTIYKNNSECFTMKKPKENFRLEVLRLRIAICGDSSLPPPEQRWKFLLQLSKPSHLSSPGVTRDNIYTEEEKLTKAVISSAMLTNVIILRVELIKHNYKWQDSIM